MRNDILRERLIVNEQDRAVAGVVFDHQGSCL
jgi:hypothetical protein